MKSVPGELIIDREVVERLRLLGKDGDRPFLVTMIDVFLQEADEQLSALQSALKAGDCAGLWRAAHTLRGACGNVGAVGLASICGELELEGRRGSLARAEQLTMRAREELGRVTEILKAEKGL